MNKQEKLINKSDRGNIRVFEYDEITLLAKHNFVCLFLIIIIQHTGAKNALIATTIYLT